MSETRFPDLSQCLGAYLHQDWMYDYGSADEAIDRFLEAALLEESVAVLADLEKILKQDFSEAEWDALMWEFGCYYDPIAAGYTIPAWLEKIRIRFKNHIDRHRS